MLPTSISVRTARAADPNQTTFPMGFVDLSGNGAGPFLPAHLVVDATGLPQVPALDSSLQALLTASAALLQQPQTKVAVAGAVTTTPAGSTGLDFSGNPPPLPPVGNPSFGGSGVYAGYGLIKTVPAGPRLMVEVMNNSAAGILMLRDDGTAGIGQAPVNATVFPLAAAAAAGQPGGSWRSSTFKGRLQIYAPSGVAQIAVMTD